jgi:hypothetical protein
VGERLEVHGSGHQPSYLGQVVADHLRGRPSCEVLARLIEPGEATSYEARKDHVNQGCELRNNDVTFTFKVAVYPDAASTDPPACAVVSWYATPTQLSSLPALQPAVQRGCVRLMDALAHAHQPRYWGNRFWTVHRSGGVDPMVRLTIVSGIRAR